MSEIKVSQMQEATNINDDDYVMIIQNGTNKKFRIQQILELVFPVGSTYITQNNTNPTAILGFGTWERLKGKVCLGLDEDEEAFNTIGQTGGEKEHTLTIDEIPSHDHALSRSGVTGEAGYNAMYSNNSTPEWGMLTKEAGGSQPHNNLQPYEVVGYMWIRRS